jgi:pimeloyl-ACP methyl ester carboxylesterase
MMDRRSLLTTTAVAAIAGLVALPAVAQEGPKVETGYLPVNGLEMYYESHGEGGVPLILIHGAFSATGTSFGAVLPGLAATRRVISLEMQAHGHTADIDRPLSYEAMAADVIAAIDALGFEQVDVYGYSMGAAIALRLAVENPTRIRKTILQSIAYRLDGIQPGLMDGLGQMQPSMMYGSIFHNEYVAIAPRPEDFDRLFEKKTAMDKGIKDFTDAQISGIEGPVLVIAGDSDLPTLEHLVAMFRLLGGGVFGDMPPGLPASQLAIVPGASHMGIAAKADVLVPMIRDFLNKEEKPAA